MLTDGLETNVLETNTMGVDQTLEQILQRLYSNADDFSVTDDIEPIELGDAEIDPVARISSTEESETRIPTAIEGTPEPVVTRTRTRTTPAGVPQDAITASQDFLREQADPSANPKSWFTKWGGGDTGNLSGFIPESAMLYVAGFGFFKPNAGRNARAMKRAAAKDGIVLSGSSYRSYAAQVATKAAKPTLAATPGYSEHGWGMAIDISDTDFGTAKYQWLTKNAGKFGFANPDWALASGSKPEAWHWEYQGGGIPGRRPKTQPKTKTTKTAKKLVDPLHRLASVDSLISAQMVFGSVMGEVYAPKTKKPGQENQQQIGLGFVPKRYRPMFQEASAQTGVPARLLAMMGKHESGFDPKAVSSAGAQGVMQVMPLHGMQNPFNARANILKGAQIFASYLDKAQGNLRLGLAYYNAGPNASAGVIRARMLAYSDPILDELRAA